MPTSESLIVSSRLATNNLMDFLFGFYALNYVLNPHNKSYRSMLCNSEKLDEIYIFNSLKNKK
jgi:hypothetical protein